MACLIYTDDQGVPSRLPLGKATLMLGSAEESQLLLQDQSVSKNHASIVYDKNKFWIRDNGSTNGSLVNGKPAQYTQLNNGDTLQFGSYKFFFDEFYRTDEELEKTVTHNIKIIDPKPTQKKGTNYRQTVQLQHSSGSQTVPMRMMLTEKVNPPMDSLSSLCETFGYLGFITFLPAIITGHMAQPITAENRKSQAVGLSLGYTFLIIWICIGFYFLNQPAKKGKITKGQDFEESVFEYPTLTSPLELIKNPMVWIPPSGIYNYILFNKPNTDIEKNPVLLKEVTSIKSIFTHGLVWMQIGSSNFKIQKDQGKLKFILETYRSNPTFWEYDSTMVPEKKTYYDPFFFPKETPQFFYEKDSLLIPPIERFSAPEFTWCFGVRGMNFVLPGQFNEAEPLSNLRVILVVKAGNTISNFKINTLEGNLTRNEEKTYDYKVTPSVLYAAIVYRITDRKPLIVSTYDKYFSLEDSKALESWVHEHLEEVVAYQPSSRLSIAPPFTIKEKEQLKEPAKPAKPKVNFFIQETK